MARPRKVETMSTVSTRLPSWMLERVDDCAVKLEQDIPLFQITRADAIRYLLDKGLTAFAKEGGVQRREGGVRRRKA